MQNPSCLQPSRTRKLRHSDSRKCMRTSRSRRHLRWGCSRFHFGCWGSRSSWLLPSLRFRIQGRCLWSRSWWEWQQCNRRKGPRISRFAGLVNTGWCCSASMNLSSLCRNNFENLHLMMPKDTRTWLSLFLNA